jgi:hypothetical protein
VKPKTVGASSAWQRPRKRSFFSPKTQLTSVEDSTNAPFATTRAGCRANGRQLKVFIENFLIAKIFLQKIVYYL